MRRFQKENSFIKVGKKLRLDNVMEFPSLSLVTRETQCENKEQKNYVDMILLEKEEEKKDVYLSGWLHMSMGKDGKMKKILNGKVCEIPKYNDGDQEEDIESLSKGEYSKKALKVISEMIQNWENYKKWYIKLYGEDCYEKMYEMVYKEDQVFYNDEDEYDEYDNLNQSNIYTDEDDDY
jgi:hypothetical protein